MAFALGAVAAVAIAAGIVHLARQQPPVSLPAKRPTRTFRADEARALPDISLGKEDAPNTIVEYASMTCPHCATFHKTVLPELKTKYIDTGKARLILREFPLD